MNLAFYNGSLVSNRNVISLYNASFLYGINCFEGVRGYYVQDLDKVVLLDFNRHLDRLYYSADCIDFIPPIEKDKLREEVEKAVLDHGIKEDVYLRLTFFLDGETSWASDLHISYSVSLRSMPSKLNAVNEASLAIGSVRRISSSAMPPSVKAGANYLNSRYAIKEAKRKGFDGALFLTQSGFISESTGSCVFFVSNGTVYTPSLDCDILGSITRQRIIEICEGLGIKVVEIRLPSNFIHQCQAAFLVGSMIEIQKVTKIENKVFDSHSETFEFIRSTFSNSTKQENYGVEL